MKALLLCDKSPEFKSYQNSLKIHLSKLGYESHINAESCSTLLYQLVEHKPDVIIVITRTPNPTLLETIRYIDSEQPLPIIVLAQSSDQATTVDATTSGISVYITDDWPLQRIGSVLDVAIARFKFQQKQNSELASYKQRLTDRINLDKAKGILMEYQQVSENVAHGLLRKMAMDQNLRMGEVAKNIISTQPLLYRQRSEAVAE